jgi:autotransporter-associated beta strand protein
MEGSGTFTLAGTAPDTYTGPTEVLSGTLAVASPGALSALTTVSAGGTLALVGGVTVSAADTLVLNGFGVNGAGALQAGSGSDTWAGSIQLASSTAIGTGAGTTLTIDGTISGPYASNVSYVGSGTTVLAGADTYAGYTLVEGGILALANPNALTAAPIYGGRGTTVYSGATLQLRAGAPYALNPLILNGTGVGGRGALESLTGSNVWNGPLRIDSDATITSNAGATLTTTVQFANEGYTLTVDAVGNVVIGNTLSGAGGLVKVGPGTLTFSSSAPNLYAGPTAIEAGTLFLAKPTVIEAIGGAGVTISHGATLAGSGTIDANVVNCGVLSPGGPGSIGKLIINGNYTQCPDGVLDMEVASTRALDQLMISGLATLDGELEVSYLNGFHPKPGDTFEIMTFHASSGKFAKVVLPAGLGLRSDPQDVTLVAV